jgi:hypothetical protein
MPSNCPNLDRLLRRLWLRAVAWRVAESMGVGVAVGALAVGVVAVAMLATGRADDMLPLTAAAVGLGALAGTVRGVATRPGVAVVAVEADTQLNLADLLATALAVRDDRDPWARLVVASAERRAATIGGSEIILHRLGGRAWGGIGLVTATAIILAAFGADPDRATADGATRDKPGPVNVAADADTNSTSVANATAAPVRRPIKPGVSNAASPMPLPDPTGRDGAARAVAGNRAADGAGGAATAQTPDATTVNRSTTDDLNGMKSTSSTADRAGEHRSGNGAESPEATRAGSDTPARGRVTAGANILDETAAVVPGGRARVDGGESASPVDLQAVPNAYRDVTRAYFDDRP